MKIVNKLRVLLVGLVVLLLAALAGDAFAGPSFSGHHDPIAPVILGVTGILFFALIGRFIARKFAQPSVLGELLMGVALGNIGYWLGFDFIHVLREGPAIFDVVERSLTGDTVEHAADEILGAAVSKDLLTIMHGDGGAALVQVAHAVDVFSRYGVIFLLFLVGLEMNVRELREVGGASLRVALIGIATPFVLGFLAARFLMPELSVNVDLFVAATLGATSIGISARVLQELGKMKSREGRVILGAAVLDDILGLIMLAIVSGIIVSGALDLQNVAITSLSAIIYLALAIKAGPYFLDFSISLVKRLDVVEAKMFISFLFVMVLAWTANFIGLATIIGAFAAGVILHDGYFRHWGDYKHHRMSIRDLIAPLETMLVPIFFVLMGVQVKLEMFFDQKVLVMASGLIAAAVVGKIVSGLGAGRGVNRAAIGFGMLPRGEVGLIFASIGKSLGVISDALFASVVLMVIFTTLIAPPMLKFALTRKSSS